MKILIISPSTMPTYCGVGKFTDKIAKELICASNEVLVIGQLNQKLTSNFGLNVEYPIELFDLSFTNSKSLFKRIKEYNPDVIILQFNSAEIGKNLFLNFFPYMMKFKNFNVKLISIIHEFNTYTIKGMLRHLIPALLSSKVFFSDQSNLDSAVKLLPILKSKSKVIKIGPQTGGRFYTSTNKDSERIITNITKQKVIKIGFHGLIQPKNNIDIITNALAKINKGPIQFEFHVLGAFELIIDYGEMNNGVNKFQKQSLDLINTSGIADKTIIHGDQDPTDSKFGEIAKGVDIIIFPDVDGITSRRTSFWNLFVQSPAICLVSKGERQLEYIFDNLIHFNILEDDSLLIELNKLFNSNQDELNEIINKQNNLRLEYSSDNLKKYYNDCFTK